ncbi:unnamed protein product [Sphagnum troendelagicum]
MGAQYARAFGFAFPDSYRDLQRRECRSRLLRKVSSRFAITIAPGRGSLCLRALQLELRKILRSNQKRMN